MYIASQINNFLKQTIKKGSKSLEWNWLFYIVEIQYELMKQRNPFSRTVVFQILWDFFVFHCVFSSCEI